jgi:predicted CXXCH cytochrome family protein
MTRSACFVGGEPGKRITCISCHSMHDGDPRGQLTEKMKTNAACLQCHGKFSEPTKLVEHTKHSADSTGSSCYACHMPKIVYGIMSEHRTHDIQNPRPDETVRFGKPNACNQCHADWSANRAIAETKRLWPKTYADSTPGDAQFDEPEGQRALFVGDAVLRALTVAALARETEKHAPLILEAMQDNYPVVRYFASNALAAARPHLPKIDYLGTPAERAATLQSWYPFWSQEALRAAREARERLTPLRNETDVEVGE